MFIPLNGFRVRLAALIGGVSLLWVLGIAFYLDRTTTARLSAESAATLRMTRQSVATAFVSNLTERLNTIEMLSRMPALVNGRLDSTDARRALQLARLTYKHYVWIGVSDQKGIIQAGTNGLLEGVNAADRPWFVHGSRDLFAGDVHEARLLLKELGALDKREPLRFVDFAAPVLGPDGQLRGVVAAHANWRWADEVIGTALPKDAANNGIEVIVVNKEGRIISPTNLDPSLRIPAAALINQADTEAAWNDGQRYLSSTQYVDAAGATNLGWRIIARQPREKALDAVLAMHRSLAVLSGLGIVLLPISAFLFSSRFSRPIERLARAANRVSSGEERVSFNAGSAPVEIKMLDSSLRDMTSKLLEQRDQLIEANAHLEARVHERTEALSDLYNKAPVGYHTVAANGLISQINDTELRMLGYSRDEVIGEMMAVNLFTEEDRKLISERLQAMSQGLIMPPQDAHMLAKGGRSVPVRLLSTPVFDQLGKFVASRTAVMDVTAMRSLEMQLSKQQAINQAIVESSPNGLLLYRADGQCILANPAAAEMVGTNEASLLKQNFFNLESWRVSGLRGAALEALEGKQIQRMISLTSTFGKHGEFLVTLMALNSAGEHMVLLVLRDVTELVQANRELEQLARHDALTGLHNRLAADERLKQELLRSKRSGSQFSVLLLDIDYFKQVNDTHGHDVGDVVLRSMAHHMTESIRSTDFVARFGGEEFLVLLPDTTEAEALTVAEKIRSAIETYGHPGIGTITASIGLTQSTPETVNVEELVKRADQALYRAKDDGRNRVTSSMPSRPSGSAIH